MEEEGYSDLGRSVVWKPLEFLFLSFLSDGDKSNGILCAEKVRILAKALSFAIPSLIGRRFRSDEEAEESTDENLLVIDAVNNFFLLMIHTQILEPRKTENGFKKKISLCTPKGSLLRRVRAHAR